MPLISFGHVELDHLLLLERHPPTDSKTLALAGVECVGGPCARAALCAAQLGTPACFAGGLGDDEAGRRVLATFEQAGIDTRAVIIHPGQATPRASIWVETGHALRAVVLDRAGLPDVPEAWLEQLPWGEGLLMLDGMEPAATAAARRARSTGMSVLLDLGSPRDDLAELVALADGVVVTKSFVMRQYPGLDLLDAAANLVEAGPRLAVVTLGAGGMIAAERGQEPFWFPAWPAGKALDTTGAGDNFNGALAWAWLQGFSTRKALACAAVAGGLACRQLGGSIPDLCAERLLEEVERADGLFGLSPRGPALPYIGPSHA